MKKIWLLTLCSSMVFAQDPVSIEIIDTDEIVIPATEAAVEEPQAVILPTQDVELSTEAPATEVPQAAAQTLSVPAPAIVQQLQIDPEEDIAAIEKEEQEVAEEIKSSGITIDLGQVFSGSPTIYSVLLLLSIASVGIWSYALLSLRTSELLPKEAFETLRNQLHARSYETALDTCKNNPTLLFGMVGTAIKNRHQGSATMLEMMKSEGRRLSLAYWQKINLLNDIAIIAPMLGLLGTVLGMFYAFYDLNRSAESISALFDGLGISVGTTVGGLVVAILALMFHAITKYRLMKQLTLVEAEAEAIAQSLEG
ncbi:MAG: MotA/TolQ/ExbB proton channel family protein [Rhabdochlamydiaceae bacterium]|nr:MotA/TolQ/ExbB proton channel family protein [Rhabdochlamydiaceae bacterium]